MLDTDKTKEVRQKLDELILKLTNEYLENTCFPGEIKALAELVSARAEM
ncbi:hypothetical protein [Hutsoniella sourekii]|nr:hypothetical protein [Hutsoniella sourekii]